MRDGAGRLLSSATRFLLLLLMPAPLPLFLLFFFARRFVFDLLLSLSLSPDASYLMTVAIKRLKGFRESERSRFIALVNEKETRSWLLLLLFYYFGSSSVLNRVVTGSSGLGFFLLGSYWVCIFIFLLDIGEEFARLIVEQLRSCVSPGRPSATERRRRKKKRRRRRRRGKRAKKSPKTKNFPNSALRVPITLRILALCRNTTCLRKKKFGKNPVKKKEERTRLR